MKKTILTTICALLVTGMMAQAPQGISHQAVIRNAANELVTNAAIGAQVSILQGSAEGTVVYTETHTPQSNANGLVTFVIGQGADQSSDFSAIDWAGGPYFIKTQADPEGGANYTIEGVSQLWSVPYALSAGSTGGGYSSGDSLVLKDEQGMTRFVLNPNEGMFKMMHNDTVWYSIEVGSPHVITHLNDDGSLTVSKGNGYEIYVFGDPEKSKNRSTIIEKFSETRGRDSYTSNTEIRCGMLDLKMSEKNVESNIIRDDNGNYLTTEKTTREETFNPFHPEARTKHISFSDEKSGFKSDHYYKGGELVEINKEYFDQNGNKVIENERFNDGKSTKNKRTWNKSGELIGRETFENDAKQSETTYTSSIVPGTGTSTHTGNEKLFNDLGELFQQTINMIQTRDAPTSKYVTTSEEIRRFSGEVQLCSSKETDRKTFNADGSVTQTITRLTQGEGIYSVFQEVSINGQKATERRLEKNPELPGGGATKRQETNITHDDNISQISTSFNNSYGNPVFNHIQTANRANNSITNTIEKPGEGSTHFIQNNTKFEFQANEVVSDGDHVVTGTLNALGDANVSGDQTVVGSLYAGETTTDDLIVDGDQTVTGSSVIHGDQQVGGNSTITGNQQVSGDQTVVGSLYAGETTTDDLIVDGDQTVTGSSVIHGDQQVGGNVTIVGNLNVTGSKNFCIDHPASQNKFLVHAAIESNEVLNQYSGNVITDAGGLATVTLPGYFHLINIDFRYQLAIIGATFARAIIFSEIDGNNQFVIKTDEPNTKVSWQVTAKRNDQYLIDNPFQDVVDK